MKACGVSSGGSPELKGNHVEEADLDRAPDGPSRGRALASAGMKVYAGNHWGMPCTLGQTRLNQKRNEADLDRAPDALEVLRHVQRQNDILLQDPLGLCQASYVVPGHARACIQHVPTMPTCNESDRKQPDQAMKPGPWSRCLVV